jgi:hypothetical protein
MNKELLERLMERNPGPWKVERIQDKKRGTSKYWILDSNENHVATIHQETSEESLAMGNLISQLPELLFQTLNN